MQENQKKRQEIVDEVITSNPQASKAELSKMINTRLRELLPEAEPLVPLRLEDKITDGVRYQAEQIAKRKELVVRFVRPGKPKLKGAFINFEANTIKNVMARSNPVGALVAFRIGPDIFFGWSKYYKPVRDENGKITAGETEPFTKKGATLIAIMRALTDGVVGDAAGYYKTSAGAPLPKCISKEVDSFATRALKYYKSKFKNLDLL